MFHYTMPRSPTAAQVTQGVQLAQERMELILGQRKLQGYNAAELDPCNGGTANVPTICSNTYGFAVAAAGTTGASPVAWNGNPTSSYKLVTVTVSLNGATVAAENAVLANY
jgi:hypothetical protein